MELLGTNSHHDITFDGPIVPTFEFDAQLGERLLHTLTLPLPHETIVDVNGYHLVLVESFVEQSCANC